MTDLPSCHNCGTSFQDCWTKDGDPSTKCCGVCDHSVQRPLTGASVVAVCNLCPDRKIAFAIPANPIDPIGEALMKDHLRDHEREARRERSV